MSNQVEKRMYPDDLAKMYKEGDPYRPSNGTEGMYFMALFCDKCCRNDTDEYGEGGCEILFQTEILAVDDAAYPKEWNHGPNGQPRCTAFRISDDPTQRELEDAGQMRLPEVNNE